MNKIDDTDDGHHVYMAQEHGLSAWQPPEKCKQCWYYYNFICRADHCVKEDGTEKPEVSEKKKPPLGLTPRTIHETNRMVEIVNAIERYADAGVPVDREWVLELKELLKID